MAGGNWIEWAVSGSVDQVVWTSEMKLREAAINIGEVAHRKTGEPKIELASACINRLNIETGKSEAKAEHDLGGRWDSGSRPGQEVQGPPNQSNSLV